VTPPEFWSFIQRAHDAAGGDMDRKCELIRAEVHRLSPSEASAFSRLFDEVMDRAYTWPLWGAAYVIHGGCSDDSFADFRSSLISRGQAEFEQAVTDPDSLAEARLSDDDLFYEGFDYAVREAVEARVGGRVIRTSPHPSEPVGNEWSEDEVYDLFPRLRHKYA